MRPPNLRLTLGFLLAAAYSASLCFPPPAMAPVPPDPSAPLLVRVFPGVPVALISLRLAALAIAAVLVALGPAADFSWLRAFHQTDTSDPPHTSGAQLLRATALVSAIAYVVAATRAATFTRPQQLLYLALFPLPSLILAAAAATESLPAPRRGVRTHLWLLFALTLLVAAYETWRLRLAWHSPLIASITDARPFLELLEQIRQPAHNLVVGAFRPGVSSLLVAVSGLWILEALAIPTSAHAVQIMQVIHVSVVGWMIGWIVLRQQLGATALVVVAAILASPWMLSMPLFVTPQVPTCLVFLLILASLEAVHARRSEVGLACFGTVLGLTAHQPGLLPMLALALTLLGLSRYSGRKLPGWGAAIGALMFLATGLPALPGLRQVLSGLRTYGSTGQMWVGMEAAFFGQVDPWLIDFQGRGNSPAHLANAVAVALAPVAAPRTALRLIGDTLFDPITSVLIVMGLVTCLRRCRASGVARLGLILFVFTLLPAAISSYDRPSMTRTISFAASATLMAGLGFEFLRRRFPENQGPLVAGLACIGILGAGTYQFDRVNPRILARSAITIALETIQSTDRPPRATWIRAEGFDAMDATLFVPAINPNVSITTCGALAPPTGDEATSAPLLFWPPGVEDRCNLGAVLCRRNPSTRLFEIHDAAGAARVFAAWRDGDAWTPALSRDRWRELDCQIPLPTEARAAQHVLSEARLLRQRGDSAEAIATLRDQARRSFVQEDLFHELATLLLENLKAEAWPGEATHWVQRAAAVRRDAGEMSRLAALQATAGHVDMAIATIEEGLKFAREAGNQQGVDQLSSDLDRYRALAGR